MKVQLNETLQLPHDRDEGPQLIQCPRLLDLDPDPEKALDVEQRWISAWIASLHLTDDDVGWTHDTWESIVSKTYAPTGDVFHVITLAQQLGQNDHNYRARVAVESGDKVILVQVRAEQDTVIGAPEGDKTEARPDRTTWLRSGYGQHGELCEGPRWAEVFAALQRQWTVEEEVLGPSEALSQ